MNFDYYSLADRLSNKGSAQADNTQLMGQPKYLNNRPERRSNHQSEGLAEEKWRPFFDYGPPFRPEGSLRSPARLSDRKAWQKHYFRLRPHVFDRGTQKPCSPLFSDWRNQSRLGPTDRGHLPGKDQGTNRKSMARHTSRTTIPRTEPCTPAETVLNNRPDTNSIVGADIFSIVLWAPLTPIR